MSGTSTTPDSDKPIGSLVNELAGLVIAYVKQETVVPIRQLGRFLVFGIVGALLLAVGGGMLTIAAVRAAQSETGHHLTGNLSWVPYVAGVLTAGIGGGWAASRIGKGAK